MKSKISLIITTVLIAVKSFSQIYSSSLDQVPADWKGNVFKLSYDYPKKLPTEKNQPWLKYDFRTQSKEYMNAVLKYFIEGNDDANWVVQNNKIRKWYHAPSMSWQPLKPKLRPYGREFIHGLTKERNSLPGELYPSQKDTIQNWAVGFYNSIGAYTFGQVYKDTTNFKIENVTFLEGTVTAKLLFTTATSNEVPYIKGTLEWQANIFKSANITSTSKRSPQTVRLLQVDIAIKDSRSKDFTGWVFGTFVYNVNATGKTVWEKLVPAGLMWGNDPCLFNDEKLNETWINPEYSSLFKFPNGQHIHFGYKGRLNGPVDNPISSCLSCHSTAQSPQYSNLIPNVNDSTDLVKYFRNVKSGKPFDDLPTSYSYDYSLQLSGGVAAAIANRTKKNTTIKFNKEEISNMEYFITSMEDNIVSSAANNESYSIKLKKESEESTHTSTDSQNLPYLIFGSILLLLATYFFYKHYKK